MGGGQSANIKNAEDDMPNCNGDKSEHVDEQDDHLDTNDK